MNTHDKSLAEKENIKPEDEYTAEDIERMKKINDCVEKGSLLIGAGIAVGCAVSAITVSPVPLFVGVFVSYTVAAVKCYINFDSNWRRLIPTPCDLDDSSKGKPPSPKIIEDEREDFGTAIQEKCGHLKSLYGLCCNLPAITEKSRKYVERHREKKLGEKRDDEDVVCSGSAMDDPRFKLPSCMAKPCLKHDNEEKVDTRKLSVPLKRFKTPLRPEDMITLEEAIKATFESFPLKRFKQTKVIIDKQTCRD